MLAGSACYFKPENFGAVILHTHVAALHEAQAPRRGCASQECAGGACVAYGLGVGGPLPGSVSKGDFVSGVSGVPLSSQRVAKGSEHTPLLSPLLSLSTSPELTSAPRHAQKTRFVPRLTRGKNTSGH